MQSRRWIPGFLGMILLLFSLIGCTTTVQDQVAKVGETILSTSDFEEQMLLVHLSHELAGTPMPDSGEEWNALKKDLLDQRIETLVLLEEAQERSLAGDGSTAQEEGDLLLAAVGEMLSPETLEEILDRHSVTMEDLETLIHQRSMENQILYQLYEQVTQGVTASEEELKSYFEENRMWFSNATVHGKGFLLASRETGEEIEEAVERGEMDVDELVKQYSEDPSLIFAGDLGPIFYSRLEEAFAEALFEAEVGSWTPLVQGEQGYFIGFVYGKETALSVTFEESRDAVEKRVHSIKKKEMYRSFIQEAFEKRSITAYYDEL